MQAYDLGVAAGPNGQLYNRGWAAQGDLGEWGQAGLLNSFDSYGGQMGNAMNQMAGLQNANADRSLAYQLAQMNNGTQRYGIDAQRYGYGQGTEQARIGANADIHNSDQQTEQERIRSGAQQNVQNQRTSALAALLGQFAGNFGNNAPDFKFSYGLPNPQATQTTLPSLLQGRA